MYVTLISVILWTNLDNFEFKIWFLNFYKVTMLEIVRYWMGNYYFSIDTTEKSITLKILCFTGEWLFFYRDNRKINYT